MAIPTLTGDEKPVKKTTQPMQSAPVVLPMPPKPTMDSLEYAKTHINSFADRAGKTKEKKIDTAKLGSMTKDEIQAVKYLAPKAAMYKKQLDAHLAELQKKDPTKTELNEAEMERATGGKGKEAKEHIDLYEKYRNSTVDNKGANVMAKTNTNPSQSSAVYQKRTSGGQAKYYKSILTIPKGGLASSNKNFDVTGTKGTQEIDENTYYKQPQNNPNVVLPERKIK
jgi:hypothetical protein